MKLICKLICIVLTVATVSCKKVEPTTPPVTPTPTPTDTAKRTNELNALITGFDLRRDQAFQSLAGKPLVRGAVKGSISGTGVPYYRDLSYSLIDFAANCFWLNEQNQAANDALIENCNIYLGDINALRDGDSFYWAADELCRIVEYFGSKGSKKAGLLTANTEDKILEMMWQFVKDQSKVNMPQKLTDYLFVTSADYLSTNTWDIEGSENHHVQRFYAKWHFSKLLKEQAGYKDRNFNDGFNASVHYNAWNDYIKRWIVERAKKGLFIEMANDAYNMESLKGIYGFFDFGDAGLRELTGKFLDLFWAAWAQEQINGVSGGSKARVYQGRESIIGATHFRKLAWYYFAIGEPSVIKNNIFSFVASEYRVPLVVADIATDPSGRGTYEITQRRLGLAKGGYYSPMPFYRVNQTDGLIRYSYCTPDFIMGAFHCQALPENNWTMISSQNRWLGAIFDGDPNSRIYPQCVGTDKGVYNQHWSAQCKGTMIVQKLLNGTHSKNAAAMQVWFSDFGLTNMVEKNGWIFVSSKGAYAAVKPVNGSYAWQIVNQPGLWSGKWMVCQDQYTPIIIEVVRQKDYTSYQQFQDKIMAASITQQTGSFTYQSTYGDNIQFFTDYSKLPVINGTSVSLTPSKVMNSPYVISDFNSGIYTIKKEARSITLNF